MGSPSPSTPLRDRLLSNDSNEWIQQATSSSHSSAVSPLRIPKRDAPGRKQFPVQLARRSSSSYNHVKNNNLVSKSPFRSNIPTPVKPPGKPVAVITIPRRVSGEKRPRPSSMNEQAENEQPRGFKRRQSKGLQGLFQKEPVTNSPFRRVSEPGDSPPPPPVPSKNDSPTRSSLVTKRFHGPRTVGVSFPSTKRQRRKTVTFDERCDVVEFERDENESEEFDEDGDQDMYGYDQDDEDEEAEREDDDQRGGETDEEHDNHDIHLGDDSITGLVDSMLQDAQGDGMPHTPTHETSMPHDLETEDGVPIGRTHHSERLAVHHQHHLEEEVEPPAERSYIYDSASASPSTPPGARALSPTSTAISPGSHLPLGRTTHSERAQAVHRDELEADLQLLPGSPSPLKQPARSDSNYKDGLFPSFNLQVKPTSANSGPDPFAVKEENETPNVSFGGLEESSGQFETFIERDDTKPTSRAESPLTAPQRGSDVGSRSASPLSRPASPFVNLRNASTSSLDSLLRPRSPRISKEDVQQRLLKKRSTDSPLREVVSADVERDDEDHMEVDNPLNNSMNNSMFSRRSSIEGMQSSTDISTEVDLKDVIIETKSVVSMKREADGMHNLGHGRPSHQRAHTTIGAFEGLKFELDSDVGFDGMEMDNLGDMRSALDRLVQNVADSGSKPRVGSGLKIEAVVTEGVKAGTFMPPPPPLPETPVDEPMDVEETTNLQRHDSELLGTGFADLSPDRNVSRSTSGASTSTTSTIPPPPPVKDAIKTREKLILEKRRELRRQEEEEDMGIVIPARHGNGRPTRRRSLSTGDADDVSKRAAATRRRAAAGRTESVDGVLDVQTIIPEEAPLSDTIELELRKLEGTNRTKYHIREQGTTIYASSDPDQVSHMASAGDVNSGKAWRAVRRPSDMNEYSKQIKEYRSQERPGKAHGKLFVRVLALKNITVPLPQQPTTIACTLNNGIHFVTTPDCRLARDCKVEQEFELIEHSKLEFTLTFKVKRDPHIVAQFKANAPPPPPPPPRSITPPPSKGRFNFFGSPKKSKAPPRLPPPPPMPAPKQEDNLARYLKNDGTLARAFIAYKDVAAHCDTRVFEMSYPLVGQRTEPGSNTVKATQVGEIILQLFRLPPLPGVPPQQLPQSLEECHRGLRHVSWHKVTYFEGTLTQNGGDCVTWRRRHLRIIGSNLVAYNDVTKKAIATIDLKKAIAVEDDQEPRREVFSPASNVTSHSRYHDDCDGPYGVERSFRLMFPDDQNIVFFSDTDEEKARWLEILRALIGRIPPNPLWAELLWQRQEELARQAQPNPSSQSTGSHERLAAGR